ncbi:sugar ABC transporter ATP-binding protein [Thermotoga profunda]|uniref:sugar ABC transporter ATP-binding protein n=1 Tax=Thermotoga profunda TaxID=1508420 RepID=UPI00059799A0|nr:sugar ABC transporter ATP-binding protein [Thermotoga profunda]
MELLTAKAITKRFPGVLALDAVDFEVHRGEILSLIGENGAGKSTLIKVLSGVYRKDAGEISLNGEKIEFHHPSDAFKNGISVIHQELNVCDNLTVAENLFLGYEITKGKRYNLTSIVDDSSMEHKAQELLEIIGARFSPQTLVRNLSTAQRQMVEICKALTRSPRIIFMDEPTSSLAVGEVKKLFEIIRMLKDKQISVVFVSHKIDEVMEISDRIIVMRDGKRVGTLQNNEFNADSIIRLMVGRDIEYFPHVETKPQDVLLEVKNLTWENKVKNVSFTLRRGEVLGFAGLIGAGRTETMHLLFGINKKEAGEIYINGKKAEINSPHEAIKHGIGLIPEDRKLQGLILRMTVKDNICLPILKKISKIQFILDDKTEVDISESFVKRLSVKTPSIHQVVENLSGGNQQKVVLSKWLATNSEIIIFDEPTRGIDVGTKAEIHRMIRELAVKGKGVIMISSELPEILNLSDRIVVMWEGQITAVLDNREKRVTQEEIMYYASGKKKQNERNT